MLAQPIVVESAGRSKDKEPSTEAEAADAGAQRKSKGEATEVRPFYLVVAQRMHHILRNCLSFLRAVGPQLAPTLLAAARDDPRLRHIDWDAYRPLFDPDLFFQVRHTTHDTTRHTPRHTGARFTIHDLLMLSSPLAIGALSASCHEAGRFAGGGRHAHGG